MEYELIFRDEDGKKTVDIIKADCEADALEEANDIAKRRRDNQIYGEHTIELGEDIICIEDFMDIL
jgi:hypothetical protein